MGGGGVLGGLCGRRWGAGWTVGGEMRCWVDCVWGGEVLGGQCGGGEGLVVLARQDHHLC